MMKEILADEGYMEIPLIKTLVGIFEIEVNIDGIATKFLLDTGAANTVIDSEFAIEHDLQLSETNIMGGGIGTSELSVHKKQIQDFKMNDFVLIDFELYAVDFKHVKQSLKNKGVDDPANEVVG